MSLAMLVGILTGKSFKLSDGISVILIYDYLQILCFASFFSIDRLFQLIVFVKIQWVRFELLDFFVYQPFLHNELFLAKQLGYNFAVQL